MKTGGYMGILRITPRLSHAGSDASQHLVQCLQRPSLWATLFFVMVALMLG